jgi:hypothetical protein
MKRLVKGKAIPVTGRGGPEGCETWRFPNFPHNRLTDGGEVVSHKQRPPFTPRKIPGTHFCYGLSRPQGHSMAGRIRTIEKSNDLIGIRTRDLTARSVVPQPTILCPKHFWVGVISDVNRYIRKSTRFYFQHVIGKKVATPESHCIDGIYLV